MSFWSLCTVLCLILFPANINCQKFESWVNKASCVFVKICRKYTTFFYLTEILKLMFFMFWCICGSCGFLAWGKNCSLHLTHPSVLLESPLSSHEPPHCSSWSESVAIGWTYCACFELMGETRAHRENLPSCCGTRTLTTELMGLGLTIWPWLNGITGVCSIVT